MLEELDTVDMIASKNGRTQLVIVDAGITEDHAEWLDLLQKKIHAYLQALSSGRLNRDVPDLRSCEICVTSCVADRPRPAHLAKVSLPLRGGESIEVPVVFEHMA